MFLYHSIFFLFTLNECLCINLFSHFFTLNERFWSKVRHDEDRGSRGRRHVFFKRERVLERVFKPLIRLKLTEERLES